MHVHVHVCIKLMQYIMKCQNILDKHMHKIGLSLYKNKVQNSKRLKSFSRLKEPNNKGSQINVRIHVYVLYMSVYVAHRNIA